VPEGGAASSMCQYMPIYTHLRIFTFWERHLGAQLGRVSIGNRSAVKFTKKMTILEHFLSITFFFNISPHPHCISKRAAAAAAPEWSKTPVKMWIFHDFGDFGDQKVIFWNFWIFSYFLEKSEKKPKKIPKIRKNRRKSAKNTKKQLENPRKCGYFMILGILGTKK
jgi:hypothetical protein